MALALAMEISFVPSKSAIDGHRQVLGRPEPFLIEASPKLKDEWRKRSFRQWVS